MRLDVYHHVVNSPQLLAIDKRLEALRALLQQVVMISEEMKAAMVRIETATTDLGARVRAIQDKIGTGMTAEDVAAVNTELGTIATGLEAMAKDPENPVPPTP